MNERQTPIYEFDEFRLCVAKRQLLRGDGEPLPLTPKVFDTLLYLVRHNGKVIEKNELMREIWTDAIVEENNLSQNISILRRIFGEKPGEGRFIATVAGRGFRFVAEVREVSEVSSSKFQSPSLIEPEISNHEKNGESPTKSAPETRNLKFEIDKNRRPKTEDRKTNRFRFALVAVLIIFGLGSTAFYFWRGNEKSAANAPIKTVAVLPFKPLVAEHRDEALEMGMADTLISRLGNNREIIVRPLSSVRKFGNPEQDATQAGRALDVEAVLDGNIQRWGDKIRVNVFLVKTADGIALWTGTFDEKFTDIFVVQDAISNRVAAALALQLSGDEKTRLTKSYTANVEAYRLYLKGRHHTFKLTPPEIQKGMSYFQQAIEVDPTYALAYVGLSDAYRSLALAGEIPAAEVMPKAKAAAQKALEIDAALTEAHSSLSSIVFWYDWDWRASENHIKRAIELNPNNADAHIFYAFVLNNTGRHAEALAEAKRASELDPLSLVVNALEGQFLFHAGQTDEALAKLQKTLELDSNFVLAHIFASSVYTEKGMHAEAVAAGRKARELNSGNSQTVAFLCYALVASGKQAEARSLLEELLKESAGRYISPYHIALIYNALEEPDETFAWLERGFEKRDPRMTFLKVEPKWNNLRSDPRFVSLLKRMNFE